MALMKCNQHSSNSSSTTNVLAFARGWAKGKLGGFCWRFLSTKFNRQLESKKEETSMFYTHIHLLLTKFHLYWKITVLQVTYKNTVEIWSKCAIRRSATQILRKKTREGPLHHRIWGKHRHGSTLGPARDPPAQGSGETGRPGCGHTAPSSARPHLALAVH